MARRTFQMIDLVEIYVHWYAGRSQTQIADSLGLDRKTVRKYLGQVAAEGLVPGGPPALTEADCRARAQAWFPALVDKGLRQVTWPASTCTGITSPPSWRRGSLCPRSISAWSTNTGADGPGGLDPLPRRSIRVLRRGPGPLGDRKCSAEHFRGYVAGWVMWPCPGRSATDVRD